MRRLKLALKGHRGIPQPLWVSVLLAAESWGVPPWVVVEQPGGLQWLRRFGLLSRARDEHYKSQTKKRR